MYFWRNTRSGYQRGNAAYRPLAGSVHFFGFFFVRGPILLRVDSGQKSIRHMPERPSVQLTEQQANRHHDVLIGFGLSGAREHHMTAVLAFE